MWGSKHASSKPSRRRSSQMGVATVEVAILIGFFFTVVCGTIEVARLLYVYNTLQEVTRRAAKELVNMEPAAADSSTILAARRRAIFQTSGDTLALAAPIGIDHVRVDYQSLVRDASGSLTRVATSPVPACAAENRRICLADPNDPSCIRFVRVRICEPDGSNSCNAVSFNVLLPLVPLNIKLPISSTVATAESLGFVPGMNTSCP